MGMLEDLQQQRDEAVALAAEYSVKLDEAVSLLTVATAAAVGPKPGLQPPAAPAAAPPAPPPPPRPSSMIEFLRLPPDERARCRAFYGGGDVLEEELHAADMRALTMRNLRGGQAPGFTVPEVGGRGHFGASPGVADWYAGAPSDHPRGTPSRADLQAAALAHSIGGGPARPAAPARAVAAAPAPVPAPKGAAPIGSKTRVLGGFRK